MQPVALTFDDGPHPEWTRTILGGLEERSIKATFFVWGEQACQHGDVVREVLRAGHLCSPIVGGTSLIGISRRLKSRTTSPKS